MPAEHAGEQEPDLDVWWEGADEAPPLTAVAEAYTIGDLLVRAAVEIGGELRVAHQVDDLLLQVALGVQAVAGSSTALGIIPAGSGNDVARYFDLPRTDPYVWMSAGSNLFVNSVVSLQPDPAVPQEALKATLTGSPLGAAATVAWAALALAAAAGLVRALWRHPRAVLRDPALDAGAWCAAMLGVTVALFYASGFLYSTVVLPAMAVLLCRHLDLRSGWRRALLWGTLALMLACNTFQVVQFRQALRALS